MLIIAVLGLDILLTLLSANIVALELSGLRTMVYPACFSERRSICLGSTNVLRLFGCGTSQLRFF